MTSQQNQGLELTRNDVTSHHNNLAGVQNIWNQAEFTAGIGFQNLGNDGFCSPEGCQVPESYDSSGFSQLHATTQQAQTLSPPSPLTSEGVSTHLIAVPTGQPTGPSGTAAPLVVGQSTCMSAPPRSPPLGQAESSDAANLYYCTHALLFVLNEESLLPATTPTTCQVPESYDSSGFSQLHATTQQAQTLSPPSPLTSEGVSTHLIAVPTNSRSARDTGVEPSSYATPFMSVVCQSSALPSPNPTEVVLTSPTEVVPTRLTASHSQSPTTAEGPTAAENPTLQNSLLYGFKVTSKGTNVEGVPAPMIVSKRIGTDKCNCNMLFHADVKKGQTVDLNKNYEYDSGSMKSDMFTTYLGVTHVTINTDTVGATVVMKAETLSDLSYVAIRYGVFGDGNTSERILFIDGTSTRPFTFGWEMFLSQFSFEGEVTVFVEFRNARPIMRQERGEAKMLKEGHTIFYKANVTVTGPFTFKKNERGTTKSEEKNGKPVRCWDEVPLRVVIIRGLDVGEGNGERCAMFVGSKSTSKRVARHSSHGCTEGTSSVLKYSSGHICSTFEFDKNGGPPTAPFSIIEGPSNTVMLCASNGCTTTMRVDVLTMNNMSSIQCYTGGSMLIGYINLFVLPL
eukprot:GHVS01104966.1.p1 GENE.GHVS01104966.1~~GHVS01104966.1.p1  ORF type:complete len:702 (+),score=40.14 GHVS01104966.1:240-2108(+)